MAIYITPTREVPIADSLFSSIESVDLPHQREFFIFNNSI